MQQKFLSPKQFRIASSIGERVNFLHSLSFFGILFYFILFELYNPTSTITEPKLVMHPDWEHPSSSYDEVPATLHAISTTILCCNHDTLHHFIPNIWRIPRQAFRTKMEPVLPSLYAEPEQLPKVYQVTDYLFSVNLVVVDIEIWSKNLFSLILKGTVLERSEQNRKRWMFYFSSQSMISSGGPPFEY